MKNDKKCYECGKEASWMLWESRAILNNETRKYLRDSEGKVITETRRIHYCRNCVQKIPRLKYVCNCDEFETNNEFLLKSHKQKYCRFKREVC